MICSSCGGPANSCQWCVRYASLRGAHVEIDAVSGDSSGCRASGGAVSSDDIAEFLFDFRGRTVSRPATPPQVPDDRSAELSHAAWSVPALSASALPAPTFGQVWQLPVAAAPAAAAAAWRSDAGQTPQAAHAPRLSHEILPTRQRPPRRAIRRSAVLAAVVATFAGATAAGAVILHFLKVIPHIGTIFNQIPDLDPKLLENPDDTTIFQAIAVIARIERSNPELFAKVLTDYDEEYVTAMEVAELLTDEIKLPELRLT